MLEIGRPRLPGPGIPAVVSYLTGLAKPGPRIVRFVFAERIRARAPDIAELPLLRLTPAVVALAALDEWIVAVMKTPGRMPTGPGYRAAAEETLLAHELYERRGWLADPSSFHRAPPPLDDPTVTTPRLPGMTFEHLTFDSGYEPDDEDPARARWLAHVPNRTAHAWVLRHRDAPERPWIVCLHAFGMGYPAVDLWGFRAMWLHRALGLNVVMPIAPLHGPRRIGRLSGAAFMTYRLIDIVHGFAQAIWDTRRILSWIRAQGGRTIGVYGVSMGAHLTALLAGIERDLACVLAAFPTADLSELFLEHGPPSLRRSAVQDGLLGPEARAVHQLTTPLALAPQVPSERLFICAGLADRMATPAQAHRLWTHWGKPRIRWMNTNHVSFLWSGATGGFVREALTATGIAVA